ncbi:MAG: hypothetical protein QCI82_09960 [Candidatus Thermoplasmatota archaeon]|nr:hypothetical protein [Candidatus Thermoplasmatota archaeon]
MRYGDKDGYGSIYDDNGDLILHQSERLLVTEENVVPSLKTTWRYYGGEYILEPSKGTVYLTNERLVFINIPERMYAIGEKTETRAMNAPGRASFGIGGLGQPGSQREYFEIPNIEIMASERREGAVSVGQMVNVYVLSSGNQFHLSLVLTEDSELLMRLMNKRIKALNDLVNNLKDHFKNTDWMYTDLEKNMLKGASKEADEPDKDERPALDPSEKKAPLPVSPTVARQTPRKAGKLGADSIKYFENLYSKGLITKDVYERLVGEYAAGPHASTHRGSETTVQVEGPAVPIPQPEEDISDQELLDILSDTMGPSEPAPEADELPETPDDEPPSSADVSRKVKKVIKLTVKE